MYQRSVVGDAATCGWTVIVPCATLLMSLAGRTSEFNDASASLPILSGRQQGLATHRQAAFTGEQVPSTCRLLPREKPWRDQRSPYSVRREGGTMPIEVGKTVAYDLEELSKKLHLSERTLREYIRKGKLQASKLGLKYYVTQKAVDEYLDTPSAEWE